MRKVWWVFAAGMLIVAPDVVLAQEAEEEAPLVLRLRLGLVERARHG